MGTTAYNLGLDSKQSAKGMRSGPAGQSWQQQASCSDASRAVNHPRLGWCRVTR